MKNSKNSLGLSGAIWLMLSASTACFGHGDGQLPGETASAPAPIDETLKGTQKGHGSISIGYVNTLTNGFHVTSSDVLPEGSLRSHTLSFGIEYFFADDWSVRADIPYIDNRWQGRPHCPTSAPPQCAGIPVLTHPHPESAFLDDGKFHGDWQDFGMGVTYHTNINGYFLDPSITAYIPSHDYTFYANAAVGQDVQRVELTATLAHQFNFSNVYYRVGFGRVFAEKTFGQNIDYNKLDLELGYFINERWTAKLFSTAKKGNGYKGAYDMTSEVWYHHDQRSPHNYAAAGFGADYHFAEKYTMSSSLQREIWGYLIFNFKYAFELRLTREF